MNLEGKTMKLGLAALSFAALALVVTGCKSADTTTIPTTDGTPNVSAEDPTLAPTAADLCFSKCDTDFKAGDAKFEALDLCMEDNCKDLPSQAATRPACAGIDQGKITYSYAPSDTCMAQSCCALAQACADDAACSGMSSCFSRCSAMR